MKEQITKLTITDVNTINADSSYFGRELVPMQTYTAKAAHLLNAVLHWAVGNCGLKVRAQRWYSSSRMYDPEDKAGGGLVVQSNPDVAVDPLDEVCLVLNKKRALVRGARSAATKAEQHKTMREKVAYKLKDYWRSKAALAHQPEAEFVLNVFIDPAIHDSSYIGEMAGQVSYAEFRCLYEHLLGRDQKKTLAKHGEEAFYSIVGKKTENTFLIAMLENIEQQIRDITNSANTKSAELQNERNAEVDRVRREYDEQIRAVCSKRDEDIAALREKAAQMTATMKQAV